MHYRSLGRTGVKVSQLCLGCMNFGGKTQEHDSIPIIHAAIDAGINFIDTANIYNGGRNEEIVGRAIKDRRDTIVLATKVFGKMSDDVNAQGVSRKHIIAQCEASLKRLGTDYIDLYQIHRPDNGVAIDETLRAMDDLVKSGKVRYLGTSTFPAWQLVESLWAAKELGLNRFVCEQPPYHILFRSIERELVPMAQTYGFAIIPWSPLAGGFFTGKYTRNNQRPEASRYESKAWGDCCLCETGFKVLDGVAAIAKEKQCSISQFALAWCAAQPGITSPIVGPRTMEQLQEYLGACIIEVTADDCGRVDALVGPGEAAVPFFDFKRQPQEYRW